ncbi:hypothetical protein PoB_003489900 [Plakobranchus ocellatus]|uniref:Sulfotransferase n=1 Tax=Plakobranchus ocellatus TaxID=259542 RepID=A0AAV4APZ7_9GAST|nr:hypothetical protein PoB_003489900 [Plakobranchus ocellatus]
MSNGQPVRGSNGMKLKDPHSTPEWAECSMNQTEIVPFAWTTPGLFRRGYWEKGGLEELCVTYDTAPDANFAKRREKGRAIEEYIEKTPQITEDSRILSAKLTGQTDISLFGAGKSGSVLLAHWIANPPRYLQESMFFEIEPHNRRPRLTEG